MVSARQATFAGAQDVDVTQGAKGDFRQGENKKEEQDLKAASRRRPGAKEGQACAQSILGLVAQGDASIKAAAKAGGITKIDSVDHYSRNLLGIIADFCTIVRGS